MEKSRKRSVSAWHERFELQASWTSQVRQYMINELGLQNAARVLDVGCGTGVVTRKIQDNVKGTVIGLDISYSFLRKAQQISKIVQFLCGDAFKLPFTANIFDACVCHFLLLWLNDPQISLDEMLRVTRPGGYIVLFAEPDYGGRIDFPAELIQLGKLQKAALRLQGADPNIGRKLSHLLISSGCDQVNIGLLGGQWGKFHDRNMVRSEWETLRSDLSDLISEESLKELFEIDMRAWQDGERILFVPTFYAWGQKPAI